MIGRPILVLTVLASIGVIVLSAGSSALAQQGTGTTVQKGIQFASPDGVALDLDAYLPAGTGPFGAVILVHGGGWQWGDRSNLADVSQYLADNGLAAFTVDYRRANRKGAHYFPYPAAVDDVKTAIKWVRSNASTYHVDPSELGLLGSSAGAHLASLVGMEGQGPLDRGSRVRAIVSWSGPQDIAEVHRDASEKAKQGIEAFTNCMKGDAACASIFKEVSPITYVDPSDPPLFFSNGTNELVPLPQALEMDTALNEAGVPHQLVEVPGKLHAQHYENETAPTLPPGQTVLQASLAWLKEWVTGTGPAAPPSPSAAPSTTPVNASPGRVGPAQRPVSTGSSSLTAIVLGVAGLGLLIFAAATVVVTLRRRARRAQRVREWKEGARRHRIRSRSGRTSSSGRDDRDRQPERSEAGGERADREAGPSVRGSRSTSTRYD